MRRLPALLVAFILTACGSTGPRVVRPPADGEAKVDPRPTPVAALPTPGPTPTPIGPAPAPPAPGLVPTNDLQLPLIRVLLRRTPKTIELPEPGRPWRATSDGQETWLWGPLEVQPEGGVHWWQVGAFAEQPAAVRATVALRAALGHDAQIRSLPGEDGLTRVGVAWLKGSVPDPISVLAAAGFPGAFGVPGPGGVRIDGAEGAMTSNGEVLLEPVGEFPLTVGSRRYRGRLRIRPSGADILVINELNFERYLRGVVPAEMGPFVFPELEALKAQTVAARTYAVAHLGDHDDEGYDICATPACQVYHGVGVEHSLTNRAIAETSGLIALYDGVPIDAMYTSTCGGHTEDSSELFSGRTQPYLRGVACAWERDLSLVGVKSDEPWKDRTGFSAQVARRVLSLGDEAGPGKILAAVSRLSGISVLPPVVMSIETFSAAVLEAAGLEIPADVLTSRGSAFDRLLFLTDLYGVPLDPPIGGRQSDWPSAAALAVLEVRGVVKRDHGEAVPRIGGVGIFPKRAEASELLVFPVPLWERWREGYRQRAAADVFPGTQLERLRVGDEIAALVVRRSGGDGEADRRSAWREWVREKTWPELAQRLGVSDLEEIKILRRSDSGRVVGLAAIGKSGTRKEWTGFDVRRALDLPETLFTIHLLTRPDGTRVARFLGRGWGHGVGLCQNGAYGLARSGKTFEAILGHYYTGVTIAQWR